MPRPSAGGTLLAGIAIVTHALDVSVDPALAELAARWADAELRGDTRTLDAVLAQGFVGITTRGVLLARDEWIDRHASHALEHTEFSWDDVHATMHGGLAILTGVQRVRGIVAGSPFGGRVRGMLALVRDGESWRIAALQHTPLLDHGEAERQRRGAD